MGLLKRILFISLILLTSCKSVEYKYIPVKEIHTEEIIVRDTIIDIQLQLIKDSVSVNDTISFLENKYAYSHASFSLGKLNHSLGIKNIKIPTEVQVVERIIRDSIPYPVEVTNTVFEKKKDFFWWAGIISLIFLFGFLIFKLIKPLSK